MLRNKEQTEIFIHSVEIRLFRGTENAPNFVQIHSVEIKMFGIPFQTISQKRKTLGISTWTIKWKKTFWNLVPNHSKRCIEFTKKTFFRGIRKLFSSAEYFWYAISMATLGRAAVFSGRRGWYLFLLHQNKVFKAKRKWENTTGSIPRKYPPWKICLEWNIKNEMPKILKIGKKKMKISKRKD